MSCLHRKAFGNESDLTSLSSDKLNASGRFSDDRVAIIDTRAPGPVSKRISWMTTPGFNGNHGDGVLVLHGIDIKADASETPKLKFLLVNHRPPMDPETGSLLDAKKIGGNSTIEVFEAVLRETTMNHVKTYFDPVIDTPNEVAWVSDDSFVFTNDHNAKVGIVSPRLFLLSCTTRALLTHPSLSAPGA
jgi:arylesterase/paraoxonase